MSQVGIQSTTKISTFQTQQEAMTARTGKPSKTARFPSKLSSCLEEIRWCVRWCMKLQPAFQVPTKPHSCPRSDSNNVDALFRDTVPSIDIRYRVSAVICLSQHNKNTPAHYAVARTPLTPLCPRLEKCSLENPRPTHLNSQTYNRIPPPQ
jgi:hypothetical protein